MPDRIKTIVDFHKRLNLAPPEHPLISIIDYAEVEHDPNKIESFVFDFYTISMKRGAGRMRYGQQQYDFDEGVMYFMAPGQVLTIEPPENPTEPRSGWILKLHPDFLWNTALAKTIGKYEFFGYAVHEALFLSRREEDTVNTIVENIRQEYRGTMDRFSQNIIVSHLETLLSYSERFYQRQFITRKKSGHQILEKMEALLEEYFNDESRAMKGLPSVQFIADNLNVSKSYLASMLRTLTGLNTQQHIHEKLIGKAKEQLSTTELTVGEIAYSLGFEHPQSFSKLFKSKTGQSPLEFRLSFQ